MSWSRVMVVAVVAAVACKAAPPAPEAVEPGHPDDAVREARALVEEAYRNLRRGDGAGMMPMLAADVFVVGPGPADVGLDRSAAAVAVGDALSAKKAHKLRSSRMVAEAAPDGRSAWVTDQIELDGQPYAVVAIAAEVDDLWVLTAIEVARAVPEGRIKKLAAAGGLAALGDLPAWTGGKPPAAGNLAAPPGVLDTFAEAMTDPEARLAQLAGKPVTFVGVAPRAVVRGAKKLEKAWKKRAPTWTIGDTLAGATPDGQLAWVLATGTRDGDEPQPRRLFAIYQRIPGGGDAEVLWELVLLHEAIVPAPAAPAGA